MKRQNLAFAARLVFSGTILTLAVSAATASILITEVHPTGSSTESYGADWFELTNTGAAAADITGWKMDDSSNDITKSVGLRGVTSIAPGQSVVFIEAGTDPLLDPVVQGSFITAWFGGSAPAGFAIGAYGGSGVGLSSNSDGVSIFNSLGTLQARVTFGAATSNVSFDNAAGLNNAPISTLSVVGVNGAFSNGTEIGSPGAIANVPEPASLMLLTLAGMLNVLKRR
jgi:hypothetical protein